MTTRSKPDPLFKEKEPSIIASPLSIIARASDARAVTCRLQVGLIKPVVLSCASKSSGTEGQP